MPPKLKQAEVGFFRCCFPRKLNIASKRSAISYVLRIVFSVADLDPDKVYSGVYSTNILFTTADHYQRTLRQRQSDPVTCTQMHYGSLNAR